MGSLEKAMAPLSSTLAWKIPGTREPGGLPSMGSHRVGYDWRDLAAAAAAGGVTTTHTHPLPSSLQEPGSFMEITSFKLNCVCAQSCSTLCNTVDGSPPGSSVHGILQARILQWVGMPFSRGSSQLRDQIRVFCVSCICRWIIYHCATWEAFRR